MESAIKLAERFIAGVSRHSPATADVTKPARPAAGGQSGPAPSTLNAQPSTTAREPRPPIPNARPLPRAQGVFARTRFALSPPHAAPTIHPEPITGHLKTNIILIDFEDVQPKDLAQLRGRPVKTKVFCGANQTKVPFDLAAELQPLGPDAEYIKIQGTGPNALDFHIAYYIGRLSSEIPGATFHIVSKDKGFDPLIKHLQTQNVTCDRLSALSDIPGLSAPAPSPPPDRTQKVAGNLLNRKEARPRTVKTLTAFIKAQLNNHATDVAVGEVLAQLKQGGMLTLPDGKVTYPPATI